MDVIWAFPVLLLAIALGVALAVGGLQIGPLDDSQRLDLDPDPDHRWRLFPYMARPIRGQVLSLREKDFVEAAIAQGAGPLRVMFGELLPNLWSTIIVFFALNSPTTCCSSRRSPSLASVCSRPTHPGER